MLVSVVVCTHSLNNYPNLIDAVDSLLNQSYEKIELIVVVDGNPELYERVTRHYDEKNGIRILLNEENVGLSASRNNGIKKAKGDVIAFFDDDAIADKDWVKHLVRTYEKYDALAVGGKALPIWLSSKPDYLPEEFYWLVGVTHRGFGEKLEEVRNTFGPNISYKREVFEKIGLLNENFGFGKRGTSYIQAEEPEFSLRMKDKLGRGVIYNPEAVIYHKIPNSKTRPKVILKRAFYQGYSKYILRKLSPLKESIDTEKRYLRDLFFKYIPHRIKRIFLGPNRIIQIKQLTTLLACISAVGLGFLYGYIRR